MRILSVVYASSLFLAVSAWAQGGASEETLRTAPPAVQQAVNAERDRGATLRGIVKEVTAGVTLYEAEMIVADRRRDIMFDVEGRIVSLEEQKTLSEIPEAARAAIKRAAGNGKLLLVEKVTKGATIFYEGHVSAAGKTTEVKVDADGRPVQ